MKRIVGTGRSLGTFHYRVEIDSANLIAGAEMARDETAQQLGDYIQAESTAIAPLRQGQLIASSYVRPQGEGKVEIGYDIIYAHRQHEGVDFFHPNGRQAMYLSKIMENPNTLSMAQNLFSGNLKKNLKLR